MSIETFSEDDLVIYVKIDGEELANDGTNFIVPKSLLIDK